MIRRILLVLIICILGNNMFAQLQPLLDQYNLNGLSINPAYAGSQEALNLGLYSRNQWVGFEGAPRTFTFSMHSPMKNKKVNLGLIVLNDKLGSKNETGFIFNYAYRMDLGYGSLSLGIGAGLSSISSDLSMIRYTDPNDLLLIDPAQRAFLPEFSTGIYYNTEKLFIGVSAPLFSTHVLNTEGKFKMGFQPGNANYLLTGGYIFRLSESFELMPSVLLKTNPSDDTQLDLNCNLIFREKFWLGSSIRTNGNLSTILQMQVNPQLRIAYSYGYEISELSSYQKGSHEVMILYNFRYLLNVISPRYF